MIPLSNISITALEARYVTDALASGWLSGTGPYVTKFENALGDEIGRRHVIATCNGTLALVLALQGLGVGVGDEVICPAWTFGAPAAAIKLVGAVPIFVDVHPVTWTIDPDLVAERLSERTAAVIAVDAVGHPADYDALRAVVGGLPIIQDAAEAHGAAYKGATCGAQGDVSIFSFHANKAISTGEGGAVLTDDDDLAARMRLIANHGMEGQYWHTVVGYNYRMSNLVAAVGLAQVERWVDLVFGRLSIESEYKANMSDGWIEWRPAAGWAFVATWLVAVQVDKRDAVLAYIKRTGQIDARAVWRPLPEMPPYADGSAYPVATRLSNRVMFLPTWEMDDYSLYKVCSEMARAFAAVYGDPVFKVT